MEESTNILQDANVLVCSVKYFRDSGNPLEKPLPKEPDEERRKKTKAAKGEYTKLKTHWWF